MTFAGMQTPIMRFVNASFEPLPIGIALALQRHGQPGEKTQDEIRARVARALGRTTCQIREFERALQEGLLPGGRILANAGASTPTSTLADSTLANCFVHPLAAGPAALRQAIHEVGRTLRSGGGVGLDLQSRQSGADLVGAVQAFEALACRIEAGGGRPAALMGTLPMEHPAAPEFMTLKQRQPLVHFNLSVTVTDAFMHRLHRDARARERWMMLACATLACGDPGVLFIDTIRRNDNLGLQELITTCNPCGEQPLPDWGACVLASIDLPQLVLDPFTPRARIDQDRLQRLVRSGIAMLDEAIDAARFPWSQQAALARAQRRIGLGILGLADALILLGQRYDAAQGRGIARDLMQAIQCTAWETSVARARDRGAILACPTGSLLHPGHSASRLPRTLQAQIRRHGVRNTHLTSIAPTGMLALAWADNASPGIEPVFASEGERMRRGADGRMHPMGVTSPALRRWRHLREANAIATRPGENASRSGPAGPAISGAASGPGQSPYPPAWVTLDEVSPQAQIAMVAALQPWVDGGISKTLALDSSAEPAALARWLRLAWRCRLKGLAVYRRPAE